MSKNSCRILFLLLVVLYACSQERDEVPTLIVGQDFTNTSTQVFLIDTMKVALSTMKFDSIATSGRGRLLFGQYQDTNFGKVSASPYFRVSSSTYNIDEDATFDSIALILGYDNYFYNDTTQVVTLNVHKLIEDIDTDDNQLFNTSYFQFENTPMASRSLSPRPNRDSLHVQMPFDFGNNIFQKIIDNEIEDDESLYRELKGFNIQPNFEDNASVIGFAPERVFLRFYYKVPDEIDLGERELDFVINDFDGLAYFNKIESDVSNLNLEAIIDQEEPLLSSESNNYSYIQSGVGYATRIEFPTIKKLYELNGEGTILSATLEIKPNRNSFSDIKPTYEELGLYTVDLNNEIKDQLTTNGEFTVSRLMREDEEFGDIIYEVPVLDFLDRKLNESPETEDALVLLPFDYNYSVNSLFLNDADNTDFEAKLSIIYAIYDNE